MVASRRRRRRRRHDAWQVSVVCFLDEMIYSILLIPPVALCRDGNNVASGIFGFALLCFFFVSILPVIRMLPPLPHTQCRLCSYSMLKMFFCDTNIRIVTARAMLITRTNLVI